MTSTIFPGGLDSWVYLEVYYPQVIEMDRTKNNPARGAKPHATRIAQGPSNRLSVARSRGTQEPPVNVLPLEKQTRVIAALTEGCSVRATERLTDVHRETILNLGMRVGEGCRRLLDGM